MSLQCEGDILFFITFIISPFPENKYNIIYIQTTRRVGCCKKEGLIVNCPNCSTENPEGVEVCQECGFHFAVPAPSGAGKKISSNSMAEVDINTSKYDIVDEDQFEELPTIADDSATVEAEAENDDGDKLPATKPFDSHQQDTAEASKKATNRSKPPTSPVEPPSDIRLPEVTTFEQGIARDGTCPYCSNALVGVGEFCAHCGQNLGEDGDAHYCVECSTLLVYEAKYCHVCGTEQPMVHPVVRLVMQTKEHPETVEFTFKDIESESVIGRTIEQRNHFVEIDLSPFGAKSRGVSRRHARIQFDSQQEVWQLTDIGSQFGTFINNLQLEPNETVTLEDGQTVRFGGMNFRIVVE